MKKRMTQDEWMESNDSYLMLHSCRKAINSHPRKGRLFAVACCRRIWHLLSDQRSRDAVNVAESYADGFASTKELLAAAKRANEAHADAFRMKGKRDACPEWAAEFTASLDAWFAATRASNFAYVAAGDPVSEPGPEKKAQAALLRDIFGNPFEPLTIDAARLTPAITELAQTIYEENSFLRMPELAEALEEVGCTNGAVIRHCNELESHVRGCWVIDLILGKA